MQTWKCWFDVMTTSGYPNNFPPRFHHSTLLHAHFLWIKSTFMLKNNRWMWTHWEQPAVSCGKQRVRRRNSFLEACSFSPRFFLFFFFFAVRLVLKSLVYNSSSQGQENISGERERRRERCLLAIAWILSLLVSMLLEMRLQQSAHPREEERGI